MVILLLSLAESVVAEPQGLRLSHEMSMLPYTRSLEKMNHEIWFTALERTDLEDGHLRVKTIHAETPPPDESEEEKQFIVTAYYSPLPNQSFYLNGSYEADIRVNGNGIRGASGKGVHPGMLAGPKNYAFGTKVYLEGFGVGTINDRGSAITSSKSNRFSTDRLDIWMGRGEEGLRRALAWGKRIITGKILSSGEELDMKIIDKFPTFQALRM